MNGECAHSTHRCFGTLSSIATYLLLHHRWEGRVMESFLVTSEQGDAEVNGGDEAPNKEERAPDEPDWE